MKLFHSHTSPYVRKVMVVLHETSQLDDVVLESVLTTPYDPAEGLNAQNPLAKLPALERPDGVTLFDSRVICAFFDARANAGLYGEGENHWAKLTLEALGDGILDSALSMTYEARMRPEDKQYAKWSEAQWAKIHDACAALNNHWMDHLNGPLNMGQIAVACALSYVDFRHDARGWRTGNDALANWYAAFNARPSMVATQPPEG